MLSPYSGSIDPSSSTGVSKYNNFVKSPYNEQINCTVGNCNLIFASLAKKAKQYSLAILWVPTSGTGKMAGVLLTINSISSVNVGCIKLGPELGYRWYGAHVGGSKNSENVTKLRVFSGDRF
jgi:hypothetical protein